MHILPVEDSLVMVLSILMVEYVKTTKRLHLRQPPKQPPYHATIRIRCYAHSQRPFQKINNHVSPCCFSSNPLLFLTGTHRQEQTIILARFPLCVLKSDNPNRNKKRLGATVFAISAIRVEENPCGIVGLTLA